ncbi:hypothetical protein BOTCAL_0505g00020 [Botryotinia calthae]|uniref:Uncharacterized protein n=1 Tax=Botryotinia calthae TaxID=38488 RepID=A0A4Y8CLA7_9HELO|nr:hypothetical protein BOTCAL_0505g00020 [Botryotinia calthae]
MSEIYGKEASSSSTPFKLPQVLARVSVFKSKATNGWLRPTLRLEIVHPTESLFFPKLYLDAEYQVAKSGFSPVNLGAYRGPKLRTVPTIDPEDSRRRIDGQYIRRPDCSNIGEVSFK